MQENNNKDQNQDRWHVYKHEELLQGQRRRVNKGFQKKEKEKKKGYPIWYGYKRVMDRALLFRTPITKPKLNQKKKRSLQLKVINLKKRPWWIYNE